MNDKGLGTFCIYCQKEYGTERKLTSHVLKVHPKTVAAYHAREAKRTGK